MYYNVDEKNKRYITNGKEALFVGSEDLAKVASQKIITRQEAVVLSDLRLKGLTELFLRMYRGDAMFGKDVDGGEQMRSIKSNVEDFMNAMRNACEDREDFDVNATCLSVDINAENHNVEITSYKLERLMKVLSSTEEEEIEVENKKILFSKMEGKLILPPLWAAIVIIYSDSNPMFYHLTNMIMEGVIEL